jgi:hypothetical protein
VARKVVVVLVVLGMALTAVVLVLLFKAFQGGIDTQIHG